MSDITEEVIGDILIVRPSGSLDIMTYQKLKQRLTEAVDKEDQRRVVLDLSKVDYVASSGWAVLISQCRRVRRIGGHMVLCSLKPEIKNIYNTMSVETILPLAENLEKAKEMVSDE